MGLAPWLYAGTIFSSAFLLFLVQPIIAKQILPWFGGTAAVWTVCMVFFQVVLLAGYAYSDWITRRLALKRQALLHGVLLAASLACLPIVADPAWKPADVDAPAGRILGLLAITIGLPYFLLSTTGPLVQAWVARAPWSRRVYRLFALSNLASLAALLAYPVVLEPNVALRPQALGWSAGYALFVLLCVASAWNAARSPAQPATLVAEPGDRAAGASPPAPGLGLQLLWLALPAMGTWLLLAVTNHVTQHVAPIPFLWILPLSAYLATFILCFESDRWYRRALFLPLAVLALGLGSYGLNRALGTHIRTGLPLYVGALFVLCMVLHGEMARLKPAPRYLTRFYLMLSLGGAVGGIAVGLVAPQVLVAYYELGIGFVIVAALGVAMFRAQRAAVAASVAMALVCGWFLYDQWAYDRIGTRRIMRNFYGTVLTHDVDRDSPRETRRILRHGSINHGEQYTAAERHREPTAYFGPGSGIGRLLTHLPDRPVKVGIAGLGAGTLLVYSRPGDTWRLYEINPQVLELAQQEFTFLKDSPAQVENVLGDARLSLERESDQRYDILMMDAFSGGSLPVHLITTDAVRIYLRHLLPDGVLVFHLTNRFLELPPVAEQIARSLGLAYVLIDDDAEGTDFRATRMMLMSRDPQRLQRPELAAGTVPQIPGLRTWSDDFNDMIRIVK